MEKKRGALYAFRTTLLVAGIVFALGFFSKVNAATPEIIFTADPEVVDYNGSTVLTWDVIDAVNCESYQSWSGDKPMAGTETFSNLTQDQTFGLKCFGELGEVAQSELTVVVTVDPPTLNFTASTLLVEYNESVTLTWSSTAAETCQAEGDWSVDVGTSGTYQTPKLISKKTYYLSCVGPGGVIEKSLSIDVGSPVDAPQLQFSANDYFLEYDHSTTLAWNSLNVTLCTASGSWGGTKNFSGTQDTGNLDDSRLYILECVGEGGSVSKLVEITVAPKPTPPVELTFSADNPDVDWGGSTTLRWNAQNADHCHASWTWTTQNTSGSYTTGALTSSTSYQLKCDGEGESASQTIYVEVGPNPNPLPTLNFDPDTNVVDFNTSANLIWSTENANKVTAELDWTGTKTLSGSYNTGNLTDDKIYRLKAEGLGGSISKVVNVYVNAPTEPPTVEFWSDDYNVSYNSGTDIHWSTEFADWCYLGLEGDDYWVPTSGNEGTGNLTEDLVLTLECGNEAGSKSQSIMVTVNMIGEPPTINLWADDYEIDHNTSTNVYWSTENAEECRWDDIGYVDVGGVRDSGKIYLNPKTLHIECIGPGGVSEEIITIEMIPGSPYEEIPLVYVWADEDSFLGSGRTNVHWTTTDAEWCTTWGYWQGKNIDFNGVIDTGDFHETRTYGITCGNNQGESSSSATLTITDLPDVQLDFWADETEVGANGYTNLNWYARNAIYCIASGSWSYSKAVNEERFETVGPLDYYTNVFILECKNWTSEVKKSVVVYAGDPPPEVIFNAPYRVGYNNPALLYWNATNADHCVSWSNNSQEYTWTNSNRSITGNQLSSNLRSSTRFYIECYGPGGSTRESEYVRVGSSSGSPPSISFSASDYVIEPGGQTTLTWSSDNASYGCAAFSEPLNNAWTGSRSTSGSVTLTPSDVENANIPPGDPDPDYTATYKYILECTNGYGTVLTTLTVAEGNLVIERPSASLWADNYIVGEGGTTTLHWNSENASSCTLTNESTLETTTVRAGSGQMSIGPLSQNTTYNLSCENPGGMTTTSVTIGTGGVMPDMTLDFWADDYDLSSGDPTILRWNSTNASSCEASGSTITGWQGRLNTVGQATVRPENTNVFEITCTNPSIGTIVRNISIKVAKLLICPNPAIVIKGTDSNLKAWYKQDADENFNCENTTGAVEVTAGYTEGMLPTDPWNWRSLAKIFGIKQATADDFFGTDWASTDDSFVSSVGGGVVRGNEYTTLAASTIFVTATYKETTGSAEVMVLPPPITCWRCTPNKNCLSEVQYPEDGLCSADSYPQASQCRSVCVRPTDWIEVVP